MYVKKKLKKCKGNLVLKQRFFCNFFNLTKEGQLGALFSVIIELRKSKKGGKSYNEVNH